eukprot:COSAG05_NODE_792_length_7316_cov_31.215325_1_plen_102_part_00
MYVILRSVGIGTYFMHMRAQSICISFSDLCGQVYNAGPSRAAEAQQDYRAVAADPTDTLAYTPVRGHSTMRGECIGHFQSCMTEIYLHIDARMADYIRTHP